VLENGAVPLDILEELVDAWIARARWNENAKELRNMADTPPDRLSINPRSPHFDGEVLRRGVGIRFKGRERTDVEEYSMSEGWIRVAAGKALDRYGQPITIKLSGPVEAWYYDQAGGNEDGSGADEGEEQPAPAADE
jgi:hypothetical protein